MTGMARPAPRAGVFGRRRAIVTGHHLASQSALDTLRAGGSLVDAMISASAVMAVALPHATSLGGCGMMLYYDAASGTVQALNGTGRAPGLARPDAFGDGGIGPRGPSTWVVPGLVRLWEQAHRRHGRLPWASLMKDAVRHAADGIGCSSEIHRNLQSARPAVVRQPGFGTLFAPEGRPLTAGDLLRQPALADTLTRIARDGAGAFYEGPIARSLDTFAREQGGLLCLDDMRAQRADWVPPVSLSVRDRHIHVMPPNSLGVLMLAQLEALAPYLDEPDGQRAYAQIQIARLCLETFHRKVADPAATWPATLDPARVARRLASVADAAPSGARDPGDTAGIVLADGQGNALAMLQSVFQPFGSGCVDPATGILMNNRLIEFDLDPASPNVVGPGKRPVHTLNPYIVMEGGRPSMLGVSPGGVSQTTTGVQVIAHACFEHMPLAQAIDAPRWSLTRGGDILLEPGFEAGVARRLREAGVPVEEDSLHEFYFGSAKAIRLRADGTLEAAADLRRQACALAD
ncbi:gamma-glutamyltranspeptidase/glutathione hydrolase [Pigmentiphaga kullae]|uniref:Gamma-glutamyltranspeptidase/glutathione hydrolase n=2 Tax=Pigmentiphaga kullae TaxID=151784 RepID=A0A4Q7NEA5_9BURK|nr:gamma-glutamyltranspeptidase/glutathione hydrolase [Pigmentiphaga kullae]